MIDQILKSIPDKELNQKHFVNFYFYGDKKSIFKLISYINENSKNTHCLETENGVCIHEICLINRTDLQARHSFYQGVAEQFALEYDGFEIELRHSGSGQIAELNEFAPFFQPGEVFSWKTGDGKWIAGVYYGGKYSDLGCFFNIYDKFFDSESVSGEDLEKAGFLYRNPVLLKIDSKKVNKIHGINQYSEQSCFFRAEIGEQSLDYFYDNDLIPPDGTDDDYLDMLLSMYQSGKVLHIENWMFFEYVLKSGGVTVLELTGQDGNKKVNSSYCFGALGNMTMVESRLKGENRDLVFLSDEIFRRKSSK